MMSNHKVNGASDESSNTGLAEKASPAVGESSGAPVNGLSLVRGSTTEPLRVCTIPQLLKETVARFGQRDAVIFPESGKRLSYNDFDQQVDTLAAGLLAIGLEKGDRIGIWSPNRLEWIFTQFASARIGLILVNINPAYRLTEVEYALNKVACKALVIAKRFKSSDYVNMMREISPELESSSAGNLDSKRLPNLKSLIVMSDESVSGAYTFNQVMELASSDFKDKLSTIDAELDPNDLINVQFTSGTTGSPKGATLTHYNIINNAIYVTDRINLTESDRLCIPVPLYHCFGMVMGVLGVVSKGAAMIFPGESFDPETTLDALVAEKCTAIYGVPTMFVNMLELLEDQSCDLGSLRTGIMAGAPCPIEIMERVNSQMNLKEVTICYGMTETSPVSFQSFVDDPIEKRCATVGRVHPHLEIKLVDEEGEIVAVGQTGELCTRGYSIMDGYWEDDEKTAESILDGWMHTGDLASFDEQGFCSIVGRLKDMIIRGGENIYPREIEEYLFTHPEISVVQVFGIPNEKHGEEVCAWVVPKAGESIDADAVRQFCHGQIAHFKIPKHVQIVNEIPMTVTGKPQKFVMRDQMLELLKSR